MESEQKKVLPARLVDKALNGTLILFVINLLFELATRDTPPVVFTLEV